jgi:hypothetical protein
MAFPGERNGAALRSFPDHRNGDIEWNTIWANSVISSITHQAPKGY